MLKSYDSELLFQILHVTFYFLHHFRLTITPRLSAQVEVKTADIMVTIPEYFEGKNVLITGATGFMGKVLRCSNMPSTDTERKANTQHEL